ncbi:DNA-binding transcriptional regulator, AcrR family [Jiangella alkaliphila]|uniref:DNA-binding transcriptional regulator, AcrR family n=1 Tax=Jiangella alkaliphila TaxID=419479 RepID=A0A1H2LJD4_9ACTN|nr:TetR/AcrR family transcriptional regulator [Jiangella alkaliphila]SDU81130.1 DNA-binding transcriptional regulator, AcrR family [Jiangella alkaliphila]
MATRRGSGGDERRLTLTEQARRGQLIEITIELVAEKGYGGTSLARIAEAAGITKAAVLYHFPTKDALVEAAYEHVLVALTTEVGEAVEAADAAGGPGAYVRSMIGHLHEHPRHTRMIVEALVHGGADHAPEARWGPLAQLIEAAAEARAGGEVDARTLAIIVGGGIDAIVSERLHDPRYDTRAAADLLTELLEAALSR